MLLNEQRQKELFDKIIAILDNPVYKFEAIKPILELDFKNKLDSDKIFDTLGYFQATNSNNVFMCPDLIKVRPNAELLAEIVYIHEAAHYLHYHIRKNTGNDFSFTPDHNLRVLIVESFAQLITHKVCLELSDEHYKIFEELKKGQPIQYTRYNKPINPYTSYSKATLLKTFVKFNLDTNDNLDTYLRKIRREEINGINGINENTFNQYTLLFDLTDAEIFKQPTPWI